MKKFIYLVIYVLFVYSCICVDINPNYSGYEIPFIGDYLVHNLNVKTTRIKDINHKQHDLYNKLDDTQKVVYDALLTQSIDILEGNANTISVYLTLDTLGFKPNTKGYRGIKKQWQDYFYEDLNIETILTALKSDYGYYAWWYGGTYVYQTNFVPIITNGDYSKSIVEIEIKSNASNDAYYINDSLLASAQEAYNNAKEVAESAKEMPEYDKMAYFRDYLINTSEYDYDAAEYDTNCGISSSCDYKKYIKSHSFINMFDNNPDTKVVCDGYAKSFLLLCDLAGIENCYYVEGTEGGEAHAWNKYYIEEDVYLIDVTFYGGGIDSYMVQIDDQSLYTLRTYYSEYNYVENTID